ncbi:MAG: helix-turn-helix transcriptional regulator [Opitutae bacterium]|nr:helix-turn-helix transcriptional regulator [Opitutae bacterium]
MKRTHTGIALQGNQPGLTISCPFQPAQILSWNDSHSEFSGRLVSIKEGLDYLSLELRIDSPLSINIDFTEERLVLGYVNSGWAKAEAIHGNVEKLEPGQWFRFSSSALCLDRTSAETAHIDLILCSQELTRLLVDIGTDAERLTDFEQFANGAVAVPFNSGQMNSNAFEASRQIANSSIDGLRHRLQLESNVLSWIAEIVSQSKKSDPFNRTLNANDRDAMTRIIEEMRNDPGREYSINDLCKLSCLNEHKLKLAFKSTLGKTAFTFLREVRMNHAAELLKNDRLSVIQVANEVGYSNASHFARAFKDRHGLLPKAYQCLQRLS